MKTTEELIDYYLNSNHLTSKAYDKQHISTMYCSLNDAKCIVHKYSRHYANGMVFSFTASYKFLGELEDSKLFGLYNEDTNILYVIRVYETNNTFVSMVCMSRQTEVPKKTKTIINDMFITTYSKTFNNYFSDYYGKKYNSYKDILDFTLKDNLIGHPRLDIHKHNKMKEVIFA